MTNPQVVNRIAFRQVPTIGTVLMIDAQRYVVVATLPHRRKDGRLSAIITWRGHCADCGEPFELRTGLKAQAINRRCETHHTPGRAVTAAARQRAKRAFAKRKSETIAVRRRTMT